VSRGWLLLLCGMLVSLILLLGMSGWGADGQVLFLRYGFAASHKAGVLPAAALAAIAPQITPFDVAGKPPVIALCQSSILLHNGTVRGVT
jgi:hypothetical protein